MAGWPRGAGAGALARARRDRAAGACGTMGRTTVRRLLAWAPLPCDTSEGAEHVRRPRRERRPRRRTGEAPGPGTRGAVLRVGPCPLATGVVSAVFLAEPVSAREVEGDAVTVPRDVPGSAKGGAPACYRSRVLGIAPGARLAPCPID
eukprot:scaffold2339_cov368-Prasinococcus_capsulatus_cf.AAC.2